MQTACPRCGQHRTIHTAYDTLGRPEKKSVLVEPNCGKCGYRFGDPVIPPTNEEIRLRNEALSKRVQREAEAKEDAEYQSQKWHEKWDRTVWGGFLVGLVLGVLWMVRYHPLVTASFTLSVLSVVGVVGIAGS